jgi:hypothetical protein
VGLAYAPLPAEAIGMGKHIKLTAKDADALKAGVGGLKVQT